MHVAGVRTVKLTGDMPREGRVAAIEAFNTLKEVSVILISLKAGGEGLNLQAANHVFLIDPFVPIELSVPSQDSQPPTARTPS